MTIDILWKIGPFQRAGAVFPQKSEMSAPVLTPPRRQQVGLSNQNMHNPDYQQDAPGSSTDFKISTLRYTFDRLYVLTDSIRNYLISSFPSLFSV